MPVEFGFVTKSSGSDLKEESHLMERSAKPTNTTDETPHTEAESLIEEVSIDGMCGVY
jgi:mycofactocin precursor